MTAEKMLQALDEDRLYLPADVLSASLASSGAEQDMDWAIEAGCRLQASQTDRGSILLHAQDNVIGKCCAFYNFTWQTFNTIYHHRHLLPE